MTTIFLPDLKKIYTVLFRSIKQTTLFYKSDYYWCVCGDDLYLKNADRIEVGVGSLVDDFAEIKRQLKRTGYITNIDIDRLAFLIQGIVLRLKDSPQHEITISVGVAVLHKFWAELIKRFKKSNGSDALCIDKDMYWVVVAKDAENFDNKPTVVQCSLSKDWSFLTEIIQQDRAPEQNDFELFSRVLRVIGQNLVI